MIWQLTLTVPEMPRFLSAAGALDAFMRTGCFMLGPKGMTSPLGIAGAAALDAGDVDPAGAAEALLWETGAALVGAVALVGALALDEGPQAAAHTKETMRKKERIDTRLALLPRNPTVPDHSRARYAARIRSSAPRPNG